MTTAHKKSSEVSSLNLTQASQGLKKLNISMSWAFNPYGGKPMDVDFACFILGRDGQTREDGDFVFYNNPQGAGLAVKMLDAAETGSEPASLATSGFFIDLDNLPFDIWRLQFVLSIYQGVENDQSFDVLREAVFRIENADTGQEILRSSLTGQGMGEAVAIRVADLHRDGVEWHFAAIKEPVKGGLAEVAKGLGLLISSTT